MARIATGTLRIGRSVQRRLIPLWVLGGAADRTTLLLGGMHGDEPKGVYLLELLLEHLFLDGPTRHRSRLIVVPVVNPDGYQIRKRCNARGVDLNRNFPTANWRLTKRHSRMYGGGKPASEPETRAVIKIVDAYRPARIVTVHSISGMRQCNNYDGPARALAQKLSRYNHYPVTHSIGYPTPGSFGSWAGSERRIPTVTLELPSHHSPKRCWEENRDALLAIV